MLWAAVCHSSGPFCAVRGYTIKVNRKTNQDDGIKYRGALLCIRGSVICLLGAKWHLRLPPGEVVDSSSLNRVRPRSDGRRPRRGVVVGEGAFKHAESTFQTLSGTGGTSPPLSIGTRAPPHSLWFLVKALSQCGSAKKPKFHRLLDLSNSHRSRPPS